MVLTGLVVLQRVLSRLKVSTLAQPVRTRTRTTSRMLTTYPLRRFHSRSRPGTCLPSTSRSTGRLSCLTQKTSRLDRQERPMQAALVGNPGQPQVLHNLTAKESCTMPVNITLRCLPCLQATAQDDLAS